MSDPPTPTATDAEDGPLEPLFRFGLAFGEPHEVLRDLVLTEAEKQVLRNLARPE